MVTGKTGGQKEEPPKEVFSGMPWRKAGGKKRDQEGKIKKEGNVLVILQGGRTVLGKIEKTGLD